MPGTDTLPAVDYTEVDEANRAMIAALETAVRTHPNVAAEVLRAVGMILATRAYTELSFDESSEAAAISMIRPQERLAAARPEDQPRIVAANIIGRTAVWAKRLAEETAHDSAA